MAVTNSLRSLFSQCFGAKDRSTPPVSRPRNVETITISRASTITTEKSIKVIVTPTVIETTTPLVQEALTVAAKHTYRLDPAFPVPEIQNGDEILIRNCAVGLNPIDWKTVDWNFCLPAFPWVTGREMSGVVEQVGENVTAFKKGDRVWTSTYYRDIRSGCFQEYVIAPSHTVQSIPSNLGFEAAACLGVCGLTAAMTLWHWLDIPLPEAGEVASCKDKGYLLIWGGSSVTGQFMIQLAAFCGYEVITVASERTKCLLSGLGASHVITRDGKSGEQIASEVRAIGGDNIVKGADIVGPETAVHCVAALSNSHPVQFAALSFLPKGYTAPSNVDLHNVEMKWFILDKTCERYAKALNRLLEEGIIRTPELEVLSGGLAKVEEGLELQKQGTQGARKLVVSLTR